MAHAARLPLVARVDGRGNARPLRVQAGPLESRRAARALREWGDFTHVDLSDRGGDVSNLLKVVAKTCPNLEELCVARCDVNGNAMARVFRACPRLRVLDLRYVNARTHRKPYAQTHVSEVVERLRWECPDLQELYVGGTGPLDRWAARWIMWKGLFSQHRFRPIHRVLVDAVQLEELARTDWGRYGRPDMFARDDAGVEE